MTREQRVVDPEYLLFESPREQVFITGSEAVAEAIKRAKLLSTQSHQQFCPSKTFVPLWPLSGNNL